MSNKTRGIVLKSILLGLVTISLVLGGLLIYTGTKISKQNKQIDTLQETNEVLNESLKDALTPEDFNTDKYVILRVFNADGGRDVYFVDKTQKLSVYDFLLTQKGFTVEDFQSYDGTNYYFANVLTDVLELIDNPDYYETSEWDGVVYTSLVVGLQAIVIDQDLTVVKTGF